MIKIKQLEKRYKIKKLNTYYKSNLINIYYKGSHQSFLSKIGNILFNLQKYKIKNSLLKKSFKLNKITPIFFCSDLIICTFSLIEGISSIVNNFIQNKKLMRNILGFSIVEKNNLIFYSKYELYNISHLILLQKILIYKIMYIYIYYFYFIFGYFNKLFTTYYFFLLPGRQI